MLRVLNDITLALDNHKEGLLILLDLSSAFDKIDHSILLHRLQNRFGFHDTALEWITSYLTNRSQSVIIDGKSSKPRHLACGVPQGSVLEPMLFSLYVAPLEDAIKSHGLVLCMLTTHNSTSL